MITVEDAVPVVAQKGDHLKDLDVVVPVPDGRQPLRRVGIHVRRRLEGGKDHPHKGEEHDHRADHQEGKGQVMAVQMRRIFNFFRHAAPPSPRLWSSSR